MPTLLECLKKYLIFSFLHNSLTDSNIGGLVIFGVGTNERPRSSNWRSVLETIHKYDLTYTRSTKKVPSLIANANTDPDILLSLKVEVIYKKYGLYLDWLLW